MAAQAERSTANCSVDQPVARSEQDSMCAVTLSGVKITSIPRRRMAVLLATGAVALAAPAGASAQIAPIGIPFPGGNAAGGNAIGTAGCVGTNRPSVGGNNGSTSAQACGALLNFSGPQIGQISSVIGPTVIGSPASVITTSAGPITAIP
jgi:hypothetical protein